MKTFLCLKTTGLYRQKHNSKVSPPSPPPPPKAGLRDYATLETADDSTADSIWFEPRITHTQKIQGKIKQIRDRSASTKRKGCDNSVNHAKSARLEPAECPHLKVIDQNKSVFKKVLDSLSNYSGKDQVICDAVRDLSIGMNGINDILGVLMAERLIPGESPEIIDSSSKDGPQGATCLPPTQFPFPSGKEKTNPRMTLQQPPLGDHNMWAKVTGRQQRKEQLQNQNGRDRSTSRQYRSENDNGKTAQENSFIKAVKDAERSILLFNLNLGTTPIMNPNTISGKVTLSLLNIMKEKENTAVPTQEVKDFINDILSQVVKMEFYGSKTVPCKIPGKSSLNGSYFTIPVKLMFKDRKGAQTASELLRDCVGISSTTPYHKSLRAAISLAIKLVKEENPGYQAKANLDLNGKTLKCFIRTDSNPPGSWAPYGSNIPLPAEALDPACKNFSNMCLQPPMRISPRDSRKKTRATDTRGSRKSTEGMDLDSTPEKTGSSASEATKSKEKGNQDQTEAELALKLKEIARVSSPLPEFMLTPKNKGTGRRNSLLVQHSPPNISQTNSMGSFRS
jgi:hypothetical protein